MLGWETRICIIEGIAQDQTVIRLLSKKAKSSVLSPGMKSPIADARGGGNHSPPPLSRCCFFRFFALLLLGFSLLESPPISIELALVLFWPSLNNCCSFHPLPPASPSSWIVSFNVSPARSTEFLRLTFSKSNLVLPISPWLKRAPPPGSPAIQLPSAAFCSSFYLQRAREWTTRSCVWILLVGVWVSCAMQSSTSDILMSRNCFLS